MGFRNHKYFFLLLFYTSSASIFVAVTMGWSVFEVVSRDSPSLSELFLVLFGETLTCFLALIVTGFFGFHVFLAIKGLTTIEFCERSKSQSYDSVFSKGVFGNFQEILGKNMLIWLLPIHPGSGDGLSYEADLNRFGPDKEDLVGKSIAKGQDLSVLRDDAGGTGGENVPLIH